MKKREFAILAVKIAATAVLFYYVNRTVKLDEIKSIDNFAAIFFIALGFGILQQFLLLCRWFLSLRATNIFCGKKSVIKSYFIGQFLGTVSPARSGDLAKIFYLEDAPKKRGLSAIFLDAGAALLTLFITGLWKIYPHETSSDAVLLIDKILTAAGISAIILTVFFAFFFAIRRQKNLLPLFSLALLQHVVLIVQGALIFSVLLPVSFLDASFAVASAYCIMPLVPIAVAAIGIREFSLSLLLSAFVSGQNIDSAVFAASYVLLLCNNVLFMFPGWAMMALGRKSSPKTHSLNIYSPQRRGK